MQQYFWEIPKEGTFYIFCSFCHSGLIKGIPRKSHPMLGACHIHRAHGAVHRELLLCPGRIFHMETVPEMLVTFQSTYFLPLNDYIPKILSEREQRQIGYYQWVSVPLAIIPTIWPISPFAGAFCVGPEGVALLRAHNCVAIALLAIGHPRSIPGTDGMRFKVVGCREQAACHADNCHQCGGGAPHQASGKSLNQFTGTYHLIIFSAWRKPLENAEHDCVHEE